MQFRQIIGQTEVKNRLIKSIADNRVAHTQLFLGPEGSGNLPMALAFGQYINCHDRTEEDSCGICSSCVKFEKFSHPDLHFYFPNTKTESVKDKPKSSLFLNEWRQYLDECSSYASQSGWFSFLGVGNKQGIINVRDASDLIAKMAMKPYEANYKVVIIWMAEKLNMEASNKLLKTLEEPPDNTLIILIAERYELIIPTVRSRAQFIKFNKIDEEDVEKGLSMLDVSIDDDTSYSDIAKLAKGSWNAAMGLLNNKSVDSEYFLKFRQWLRLCFIPKNHIELFAFNTELSRMGREWQKSFLNYGLNIVHNSIMANGNQIHTIKSIGEEFDFIKSFSPFINNANRSEIYKLLNEAIYHIERNAHAGILFTDLSLKMVRLLSQGKVEAKK